MFKAFGCGGVKTAAGKARIFAAFLQSKKERYD